MLPFQMQASVFARVYVWTIIDSSILKITQLFHEPSW